jgi:hypothetical protein
LQTSALAPALPGDDVTVSGKSFPEDHAKILTIHLEPKNSQNDEREAVNKGVSGGVLTVGLPLDLKPGEYEIVIHGPMWPLLNNGRIDLSVLGKPEITSIVPLAGFPEFGPHGTNVTIWGNNFDLRDHAARTAVFFGISVRSC